MNNNVDHPNYYNSKNGIEVIDIIESFGLGFSLGNSIKYILRAGKKQDYVGQSQLEKTIDDLEKASWYINREIDRLKRSKDDN